MRQSLKITSSNTDIETKNTKKDEEYVTLRDSHISAGQKEQLLPEDPLSKLLEKLNKDKETARKINKSDYENEVNSKLKVYENGPLTTELDIYIESQKESVSKTIKSEIEENVRADREKILKSIDDLENERKKISTKIKSLEEADEKKRDSSQISSLSKKLDDLEKEISTKIQSSEESKILENYDIDADIAARLEQLLNEERKSALSKAENTYKNDLKPIYDERLESTIEDLERKYDEDYNSILKNETICRIHYYFLIDVPETVLAEELREKIEKRIVDHNLKKFKYDDMGDRILLNRQRSALTNFTKGYLMNPFLATFLFNPSADEMNLGEVDSFYIENLNDSQKESIRRSVSSNGMFLIQGPPGTGKTQVIAEITAQMIERKKKIMIASENHKAIDNAFDRIPKIPQVRPVRFLSDDRSKDHPYSQEALLNNFYTNIVENLKKRIGRFENYEEYRNTFREKYDTIKILYNKVQKNENKISKIKDKKASLEIEYRGLQEKIRKDREEDRVLRTEINNFNNAIREIEFFEYNDETFIEALYEILREGGVEIPDAGDISDIASLISNMSRIDMAEQITLIKEHELYIDLLDKKAIETSHSKIVNLNEEIREYENKNKIKLRDLYLFDFFGSNVSTDNVLETQDRLRDFVNNEIKSFKLRIKEYERMYKGTTELDETRLKNLEFDIKDLESDPVYTQFRESDAQFKVELRNIMQDLEIQSSYNSIEDALAHIESKWYLIQNNQRKNANRSKVLIPVYKDIIRYISNESVLKADKERYTDKLTELVNVIGMTCTSRDRMGELDVNTIGADVVIIDEVSKIPFIEILQPLLYGKTAILVGDHKQLPPMYSRIFEKDSNPDLYDSSIINEESDAIFRELYEKSFFEELFNRSPWSYKSSLSIQYRMHPDIMNVVNFFYSSTPLSFGGNPIDKEHHLNIVGANGRTILNEDTHILFVDCKGMHTRESGSTSLSNESEIKVVSELIRLLDTNCKYDRNQKPLKANKRKFEDDERLSLGVITAYADQARQIRRNRQRLSSFNQDSDEKYIVSTVDDFQGDERDIIILSTVRTSGSTPFLEDFRRINVAMSRARRLLIIVGNGTYLRNMKIKIDGRTENIYSKIIERIRTMGGYREDADILGGGL